MLQKIDWFILGKFEKFAHWFQKLTGKNCFWQSRILIITLIISDSVHASIKILKGSSGIVFYCAVSVLSWIVVYFWTRQNEKKTFKFNRDGLSNPFKKDGAFTRKVMVVILIIAYLSSVSVAARLNGTSILNFGLIASDLVSETLIVSILFLISCDPLPPVKSKLRQWLEKIISAVKEVFIPAPQPQPIPVESRFL